MVVTPAASSLARCERLTPAISGRLSAASHSSRQTVRQRQRVQAAEGSERVAEVAAPMYSHVSYDIVRGQYHLVHQPDILIIEGLNVLQTGPRLMVSDLFDFSIYVDARIEDIEQWYVRRFLALRTKFAEPDSHFHHYSGLNDRDATVAAIAAASMASSKSIVPTTRERCAGSVTNGVAWGCASAHV